MEDATSLRPDPRRLPPDRSPLRGYPAETAIALYLIVSGVSTLVLRPAGWVPLAAAQLIAALLAALAAARLPPPRPRGLRIARAMLPLALLAVLYKTTGAINAALPSWILSGPMERIEAWLFGGQPSLLLSERFDSLLLSEILHACYWAYFLLVPCLAVVLAIQGREKALAHVVGMVIATFVFCYVIYIWLPVRSPLYNYPPLARPLSEGFFYGLTHAFADRGGVVGGAFPSSHAAASTLVWLLALRYERRVCLATTLPTFGLLIATVYGRYHYAVDTIAGILLAVAIFLLEPKLRDRRDAGSVL